ncbi:MAG TPA: sugar phosphate isomerase/epimerase family protein, partial [Thermodesulfovibrionales bacterium]|nr:sugar phosphate isomerase/epimerase family protein [Thermodesulfovibrionales bacterium]
MYIRIGNQTSAHASPLMQPFEYATVHGFDAFEWFPDRKKSGEGWSEDDISKDERRKIRETAREKDIALSFHAPLPYVPGDAVHERLAKGLEFAEDVGARLFNVHFNPAIGTRELAESIMSLINILERSGMRLSIENSLDTTPEDMNALFGYLRDMHISGISSVGMCLDIGHANLCWRTRNDYLKYVDLLDPELPIIHIHMHENYGDFDSHLTIFTGPSSRDASGIEGLIKRLIGRRFDGNIILEQWPQPAELLDNARTRLREIIGDAVLVRKNHSEDFSDEIAVANRLFPSWRKRLEWIYGILAGPKEIDTGHLVYLAVYLRFIGAGEVRCEEDTGHHRPSNHARISQKIYSRLIQLTTPDNALVIRKIYPWLPSFDAPFMRAEPLTRIRDIAHRNDIPQNLKREIKISLQNKLHRSAGPEDLATSEALLTKITAPGSSFPPDFVKEFRLFHDELREFFNSRSLDEQLESLMGEVAPEESDLILDFLKAKGKSGGLESTFSTLSLLTRLRETLGKRRTGGVDSFGHRLHLIDIGLEGFSFVLLSRLCNYFDASQADLPSAPSLLSIALAVTNLRLGG